MDGARGGEAYEELGELYDAWCAEVVEDVPFYVGLAGALARELGRGTEGLDVVELGGGSGRIGVPLAQAGHRVTAVDLSPAQLARFAAKSEAAGTSTRTCTVVGDMRELTQLVPASSADLVVAPFRALLHVTPDRDAVLAAIAQCLRPDGALAFDVFHPGAAQVAATDGAWLDRRDEPTEHGRWRFQERARYLPERAAEPGGLALEVDVRCRWKRTRRATPGADFPDPAHGAPTERGTLLALQLVPAERWAASLVHAGFRVDAAYGWFDARPLGDADDNSIWVARPA